jgi:hypothetical protein
VLALVPLLPAKSKSIRPGAGVVVVELKTAFEYELIGRCGDDASMRL